MANRTVKYATSVHGTNPQYLIEKIIRSRIHESKYWKENCLLLNSALVLERAVDDLKYVGGVYGGNIRPTPFLCLVLKLLQIQPQRDIIYLYIEQPNFKYLRALGAFYLRLVGNSVEVYEKLEPLYKDYRKLRIMDRTHRFDVIHVDEFVDNLLREDRVLDVILPRLTKRSVLEDNRDIEPYKSDLNEELNLKPISREDLEEAENKKKLERECRSHEKPSSSRARGSTRHDDHHYRTSGSSRKDYGKHDDRHSRNHDRRRSSPSPDDIHRRRRDRSRSPVERRPVPARSNRLILGRFTQDEIDNENAIRAKVGLKPLRLTAA